MAETPPQSFVAVQFSLSLSLSFVCLFASFCPSHHNTAQHKEERRGESENNEEELKGFFFIALFLVFAFYLMGGLTKEDSLGHTLVGARLEVPPRHAYASLLCDDSKVNKKEREKRERKNNPPQREREND